MAEEQASGRNVYPPTPKLRDSCDACAASKVKCDKVKPLCGRCVSRDTQCTYRFAKRSGRQRESRQRETTAAKPPLPNPEIRTPASLPRPSPTMSHENTSIPTSQAFPQLSTYSPSTSTPFADDFDNFLSSFPSDESYTSLSSMGNDIFSQNQSYTDDLDLSFMDAESQADASIMPQSCCFAKGGMFEQPYQNEKALSAESFPAINSAQDQHDLVASYKDSPSQPNHLSSQAFSHDCAAQAISQLGQVFPCGISDGHDLENEGSINMISSVIASNKCKIEAVSKLLECYCMEDEYLLMIISIIILKLLDRYSTAIHGTTLSGTENHSSSLSLYKSPILKGAFSAASDNEGADQCRLASQLILGDLQRVQGLIGHLAKRCKRYAANCKTTGKGINIHGHEVQTDGEGGEAGFSLVLHQIEDVLRKRVRVLSMEIIDLLRRE